MMPPMNETGISGLV